MRTNGLSLHPENGHTAGFEAENKAATVASMLQTAIISIAMIRRHDMYSPV